MRICLVYDCLFPHTIGGAEKWYRTLAERLSREGHEVTYLTMRQWDRGADPGVPGVRVVAVGPRMSLYTDSGRRKISQALVFGLGVLAHLLARGRRYDVVHTASVPYFSLLAAWVARPLGRFGLVVDWFEVWTLGYWREYLGRAGGRVGWGVQRACARVRQRAFCFSRMHARRLAAEGINGPVTILEGIHSEGPGARPVTPRPAEPVVVFAGRHIREKRVPALVHAMAIARRRAPELRAEIFGDGPERPDVERAVAQEGLAGAVAVRGFVASEAVDEGLRRALCMALPSRREGYGLVVVEAAERGTPSVVVADPDNAATELVEEGVNGAVAASGEPAALAAAILRVLDAGPGLRASTARWYEAHAERLSLGHSLDAVAASYAGEDRG